jgi:peptidoglycan hydrolase-like protein with peptidoglycan-binding domain
MRQKLVSILFLAAVAMAVNGCDRDDSTAGRKSESTGADKEVAGGPSETSRSGDARIAQADKESTGGKTQGGRAAGSPSIERSRTAEPGDATKAGQDARTGSRARGMGGQQDVRQGQEALKNQGQDPGPIDGIMGPRTRQALRAFQSKNGLKQTGTLDTANREKLNIESSGASAGQAARSGTTKAENTRQK